MINTVLVYLSMSVMLAIVFGITGGIQLRKYQRKKLSLHFWSGAAFFVLCVQEIISFYWLFQISRGIPETWFPWHIQALVVFLALNLLGLSMTGKIYDKTGK